jgi:hypothetical protein
MSKKNPYPSDDDLGLGSLSDLPVIPAAEFANWGHEPAPTGKESPPVPTSLQSEQEYKFLKAVVDQPMQPSSAYRKLAGIKAELVRPIRQRLLQCGYIRTHVMNIGQRSRTALLLEALPAGKTAVTHYEENRRTEP